MRPTTPSIGRIVHFVDRHIHYPALITAVEGDGKLGIVNLTVFANGIDSLLNGVKEGIVTVVGVGYREDAPDFSWHWPEPVVQEGSEAAAGAKPVESPSRPVRTQMPSAVGSVSRGGH